MICVAALVAVTSIAAASPAKTTAMGQKNATGQKNIVQTAVAAGKFKTLVVLVKKAGLAGTLTAPGNLTVFAPTDRAFANLKKSDPALYTKVATNKKLLLSVLTYHVVGTRIPPPPQSLRPRSEGTSRRSSVSRSRSASRAARSSSTARRVWSSPT